MMSTSTSPTAEMMRIRKDGKVREVPASFLFVAAGNPCRCGLYYEKGSKCRCTPSLRRRYLNRLSGGFLDRIDLFTEMRQVSTPELREISGRSRTGDDREQKEAAERIDSIRTQFVNTGWEEDPALHTSFSGGLVDCGDFKNYKEAISQADKLLFKELADSCPLAAKEGGRNRVES